MFRIGGLRLCLSMVTAYVDLPFFMLGCDVPITHVLIIPTN